MPGTPSLAQAANLDYQPVIVVPTIRRWVT
jgi:hypothetical protein